MPAASAAPAVKKRTRKKRTGRALFFFNQKTFPEIFKKLSPLNPLHQPG
jgi:hypothetical protein